MRSTFLLAGAIAVLSVAGVSQAGSVEVDNTKPEVAGVSYQTIGGALNYIKTTSEPREVLIKGGGPYAESISANFSVTIKGDGYRPIITAPPTAGLQNGSLNGNAVAFYTTAEFPGDQTFRLENLVLLPQVGNPPTRCIRTNNNNSTDQLTPVDMTVELVDVLMTSNNGSDQPVSTDGLSLADLSGATKFADDLCFFAGFVNVATTNTIVTNSYGTGTGTVDGLLFIPDAAGYTLNVGPGSIISYMNRTAVQVGSAGAVLKMVGTKADPVVVKGNWINSTRNSAISIFASDGGTGDSLVFENVVFVENNSRAIGLSLVTAAGTTGMGIEANNVAFVNNKESAILVGANLTNPWNFNNVTIVNNGLETDPAGLDTPITLTEATAGYNTGAVTFTNSIIAGNGRPGGETLDSNLIDISAANMPVTFENCALVTAGPYALAPAIYRLATGVLPPLETEVINADPEFEYVGADFTNPDFLDVNAVAYAGAATGDGNLSGYGDYTGSSSVDSWMFY